MKKGFTLLEILIVVAITSILAIAVGDFQSNILRYNRDSQKSLSGAQDARNILRIIVKELRTMSPSNNGSYPISVASTSTIVFYSDTDGDNLKEQIRYFKDSSGNLKKGSIRPTGSPLSYISSNEILSTIAYGIKSSTTPMFEYFDTSYTGTSTPLSLPINILQVRLVKINLIFDRVYTSQVNLRNLKDNL